MSITKEQAREIMLKFALYGKRCAEESYGLGMIAEHPSDTMFDDFALMLNSLAAEQPQAPLTDDQIGQIWDSTEIPEITAFAREIERAHGIGVAKP